MQIKTPNGKPMTNHLTDILTNSFPQVKATGITTHMTHIKPDPTSKGKAVRFLWQHKEFRLTANAKVQWYEWGFSVPTVLKSNKETEEMEKTILATLNPSNLMPETLPTQTADNAPALV